MVDDSQVTALLSTTAAIVVHYRSYETVGNTVANLIQQGIAPTDIVLIDNSEQPERRTALQGSIPDGVEISFTPNGGYAAAVNAGMDFISHHRSDLPDFLIVATHETAMHPHAVDRLVGALTQDPEAAVAGPTLISGALDQEFVWSMGGYLTKITHTPSHFGHRDAYSPEHLAARAPEARAWLDGAFLAYRWTSIATERLSEDFFLYMEETDLHLRLGRKGHRVVWVPASVVWQSSDGIPPYYLARNLRLLARRNEPSWRRALVPATVAKRIAADVIKRGDLSSIRPSARGLFSRIKAEAPRTERPFVSIVNPLGGALAHYQRELADNLTAANIDFEVQMTLEPSMGDKSRTRWLLDYWLALRRAARFARLRPGGQILVVWPVLGYLDFVLLRLLGIRSSIIMHDPRPLVKAIGYDRASRAFARLFANQIEVIVHSEKAAEVIQLEAPAFKLTTLAHPMLEPSSRAKAAHTLPKVQVFGQYKPDRDLHALAVISTQLQGRALFAIDGRGWPDIPGWVVSNRFVPEEEVDALISDSAVVVIPYRHFFQSGVAIRSIESAVPFVGPQESSLVDLVGKDSTWLAGNGDPETWSLAVKSALLSSEIESRRVGISWRVGSIRSWKLWAAT